MFRSNLFKNSVTLISSQVKRGIVVARASPYIQNIPHPDHLIVVNGGASIGIAVLERLKTFYSQGAVGQSATVPKSISIVLTPPLAGSETNKFVTTPFGQSVMHLSSRKKLQDDYGYRLTDRPSVISYCQSITETVESLVRELNLFKAQQSRDIDFPDIHFHQLKKNQFLKFDPDERRYLVLDDKHGNMQTVCQPEDNETIAVIDASRVYGKYLNGELASSFNDPLGIIRKRTTAATDLYKMTHEQITIDFEKASFYDVKDPRQQKSLRQKYEDKLIQHTSAVDLDLPLIEEHEIFSSRYVPLIGSGLTTLWMLPAILSYGFKPLIINTDPNFKDYSSLMTHANGWIEEDLCKKLECKPEELNQKLFEMTISPAQIKEDRSCEINGERIIINKLYDATGYCVDKGYLQNVPVNVVIDPFVPVRVCFDYISTLREKADEQLLTIAERQGKDLIHQAFSDEVLSYITESRARDELDLITSRIHYESEEKHLQEIDYALGEINKEEHIERALRARKILMIVENLARIQKLITDPIHLKKFDKSSSFGIATLSFKQYLFKALRSELRNPVSSEIAKVLKIDINPFSQDGRDYIHHGHTPLGSATALKKAVSHLIGADVGFSLVDALTTSAEIQKITDMIYSKINKDENIDKTYLQSIIEKTMRKITNDSEHIYTYTQDEIILKLKPQELAEFFFQTLQDNAIDTYQAAFQAESEAIKDVIKNEMINLEDEPESHRPKIGK